jgi:hypothetical protein
VYRSSLGLNGEWKQIRSWLKHSQINFPHISDEPIDIPLKFPNIPILPNYADKPPVDFWQHFPSNISSFQVSTNVIVHKLEQYVSLCEPDWTPFELKTAKQAISNLKFGTKTVFAYPFSPVNEKTQGQQ